MNITAWKMNKAVSLSKMCHDNFENEKSTVTQQIVVFCWLGFSRSRKKDSLDGVLELQLWSSWRLLANAVSWDQNQPRELRNTSKSMQFTGDAARSQHHEHSKGHRDTRADIENNPEKQSEDRLQSGMELRGKWRGNSEKCVSCKNNTPNVASATSMCTTPGAAAPCAPSGADSSLVGGPENKIEKEKEGFRHKSPASLASAQPSCTPGRCCGCAQCQTPADVSEHWRLNNTARWQSRR